MEVNRAAFLPDLAGSLNNQSNRQSEVGDRVGALASISEAVAIRRELVRDNRAAFLPDLAGSLNNQSDRLVESDRAGDIPAVWQQAIDGMPFAAARAELRAAWSQRLVVSGDEGEAHVQLRKAALEADEHPPAGREPDRAWVVVAMRARHAVRALLTSPDDDLPVWATAPLPDAHINLVNAFGQATDWPSIETTLDQNRDLLLAPEFRRTVAALLGLYLDNPVPSQLAQLLAEIDDSDIDTVFAAHRADHARRALLGAWLATPTWSESFAFLRQHADELATTEVRQLLANSDTDETTRHLAILDLTTTMPPEDIESIITDVNAAEEAVFDAIESGSLSTLAAIVDSAPHLAQHRHITWAVAATVLLLEAGQLDDARNLAAFVAEHARPVQRRAHAIRLDTLRAHHPDLPGLDEIIAIIRPEDATSP